MLEHVTVRASTLAKGRRLGNDMAHDPLIRPYVENAVQYQSYHRFRIAHRAHWEQSTHFERCYQERLFNLAEKETARNEMTQYDSMVNWDLWYHQIVRPISVALWEAWEAKVNLERRYFEALLASRRANVLQFCTVVEGENDSAETSDPSRQIAPMPYPGAVASVLRFLHQSYSRFADARSDFRGSEGGIRDLRVERVPHSSLHPRVR